MYYILSKTPEPKMLQNKDLFVITYHDDYLEIGDSKVERNIAA